MNDETENPWSDHDERPSKTARKKEMTALQDIGQTIVGLSAGELSTIPLEDDLADAITTARRIKSREGLRRQMQYIGRLMRQQDTSAIELALAQLETGRKELARQFHALEEWRDQLIDQGIGSIESVVERYPEADRQHLRQLILQAGKEAAQKKPPAAARKLFRYLRELDEH